ncbi:FimB/Mfa2 family fimbrial subunit [uncultured Porphyromonas sp.]|uniref:FimB/Mfa2 family fimbrial subunit n=1 Tax=uncultured Porphyromonas sp. TaxID=159274 RepID=UPI0028041860|nr:FimB/Mfa2 family fimbrial subunit [uncultured Porphyromonas sp.]
MNKKIKALLTIGVLALVALTSSCQSDNKAPKGDQLAETYQEPGAFTIRFSVPSGDPVKYNLRMTQDTREYTIDKATLYIFENGKLVLDPIEIDKPSLQQDGTAMTYTYTSKDSTIPKGLVTIYAVANEDVTTPLVKGADVSELTKQLAKGEQKANESSSLVVNGDGKTGSSDNIPMVGVKEDVALFKQNVTVELERIVARIDIKNNVADNQLNIKSVTLENANSKSLLVDDEKSNVAPGSTKVSGVKPFLFTPGSARMDHNKVFYLYEGNQAGTTADEATYVVIKGTFRGVEKEYKIPFFDKAKNKGIDIVRNTIYRIVLGTDYTKYNLTFSLEVADWDGPFNTVVTWDAITVAFDSAASTTGFTYDAKKHELTAPKTAGTAYFTTSHNFGTAPTFTATAEASASSWLKANIVGGKVKIEVSEAATTARHGLVTVTGTNPDYQYQILVRQGAK